MATRVAPERPYHSAHALIICLVNLVFWLVMISGVCEKQPADQFDSSISLFPRMHTESGWFISPSLSLSLSTSLIPASPPPALHQPTPAIFTPHTFVAALIQPQTAAGSIAKRIIQQQSTSPSPSLPFPLSLCLSPCTSLAAGPQRQRGPIEQGPGSPLARLFIEASMGLYAASARPCPRHHQSSSAPGLLSQPRQASNRSLSGSSRRRRERAAEERKTQRISLFLFLPVSCQIWLTSSVSPGCMTTLTDWPVWCMIRSWTGSLSHESTYNHVRIIIIAGIWQQ